MIRLFSESNPLNIFLLFILGAVIRIPFFINPSLPIIDSDMGYLYILFNDYAGTAIRSVTVVSHLLAYLIIFIQGLSLNGFVNSQKLYGSSHLLFVYAYVLFSSLVPQWNSLSPLLFVNAIMTYIIPKMVHLYQSKQVQGELFTISVLVGISSLIYKPTIIFVILIFLGLFILRSFQLSEFVLILMGVALPYYLILVYNYVWDHWDHSVLLQPNISWNWPDLTSDPNDLIAMILLFSPAFLGVLWVRLYAVRMLTVQRKIWAFILLYFVISLVYIFIGEHQFYNHLFLFVLPASFYLAGFFHYPSVKFLPSIFPWLIIGFLIVRNFL